MTTIEFIGGLDIKLKGVIQVGVNQGQEIKDYIDLDIRNMVLFEPIPSCVSQIETIIKKTPSAELYRGQTDKSELGASYTKLDKILKLIEKKQIKKIKNNKLYQKIVKRIKENKHKGKTPFIIK